MLRFSHCFKTNKKNNSNKHHEKKKKSGLRSSEEADRGVSSFLCVDHMCQMRASLAALSSKASCPET